MMKIGIASFAHMHAYAYAECLNAHPEAELTAVWDDVPKRGRAAAAQFDTHFTKSYDKFLESDLDGVIICSENVHHRAMVEKAAAAGKWILCEKPLATTVSDAKSMIKACDKEDVGLGIAFPCRFVPSLAATRQRLKKRALGNVYAISCTNNGQFPGGWFADESLSGGGAVMDHTVHVADALRWMTGLEFTSVYCDKGTVLHPGLETDDMGCLHLELEGEIQVSHIASWNRAESFPTWGDVTMEFVGEKAVLNVDAFREKVDVYSNAANKAQWVGWGDDANYALVDDFVQSVRKKTQPAATGLDGLRAVEVTAAAHRSAASGKKVKL